MTSSDRYAELVAEFDNSPDVSLPTGGGRFGANTLRVGSRIFAMLAGEHLVVKLPPARVDELVAGDHGDRFDGGRGKPMNEWLTVSPDSTLDWFAIAIEARAPSLPPRMRPAPGAGE